MNVSEIVVYDYNKDNRDDLYCLGKDGTTSVAESSVSGKVKLRRTGDFLI